MQRAQSIQTMVNEVAKVILRDGDGLQELVEINGPQKVVKNYIGMVEDFLSMPEYAGVRWPTRYAGFSNDERYHAVEQIIEKTNLNRWNQ